MSDRPRKMRRTLRRISICGDVWLDIFEFLPHRQLGLEIATLNRTFDIRMDRHFVKRKWTLGKLEIERDTADQSDAIIVKNRWPKKNEALPLPDGPLPNNVVGFERIAIRYVDHKVIDFLHRIRRLFQSPNNEDGIGLEFGIDSSQLRSLDVFFDSFWPLIGQSAIAKLSFPGIGSFNNFRQRISPTFLLDLANVRVINLQNGFEFEDETNGQLLRQWLHTSREDGKPKLLKNYDDWDFEAVEQLKTLFLSAKTSVSFIIEMNFDYEPVPFQLDNFLTGERLTLRQDNHMTEEEFLFDTQWLLERGPIGGRDAEKWAKWNREVTNKEKEYNLLTFWFGGDKAIGPLSSR